ncbi:polysaccharide deacetylase family protein [Aequorivita todarodis]|uniref:polysaccharide deacetylase family protein n=1 Tax=Aequorivita todarodis TaxID=2036821 RepID=UPI00234FDF92|nr:polysaccharide deacetylase family protein [Aequorivita todarodis]MDC8000252.1 polysaccharide deacetylase family protein [Aequorivita todarodis]
MTHGSLIISLDFELMWGVRDNSTIDDYGDAILGVKSAMKRMLQTFDYYDIHATFATVGFLFNKDKKVLLDNLPKTKVNYEDKNLSPYVNINNYVGENEKDDPYHFGYSIIQLINEYQTHEMATHTYCHYYCLEPGQTIDMYESDLKKAIEVADREGIQFKSIIFPRNQYNHEYIEICEKNGLTCYRGNEEHYIYKPAKGGEQTLFKRALRLIDGYFNITGYNCYSYSIIKSTFPHNIPSSRFLRPYNKKLKALEKLKLKRITNAMTYAAKNNLVYHLWWHPHNFGRNTNENILFLEKVLNHYEYLKKTYRFQSITMGELSTKLRAK